jgi:hypothetical protein
MLACMPSFMPGSAVAPTFDPNSINTLIVQTANAAATQTASVMPPTMTFTNTLIPTKTPSMTPSPTPTFIFRIPTATVPSNTPVAVSSGRKFDCQILGKHPEDNSHLAPKTDFTMIWTVANIGTEAWDTASADYHYKSGDKLQKTNAYDLPFSVAPLAHGAISVDMRTPDSGGTFSTTWMLKVGKTEFCKMSITILAP